MSRLTRDGTAEPVSRDQILRHARGQGNINFPCSADHEQDWQPYPVDPYSAICDDHTYIPYFLDGNRPLFWYILLRYSATTVMYGIFYLVYYTYMFCVTPACVWCCDASTFTEHDNHQTSNLNIKGSISGEHNKRQCPYHNKRQTFAANSIIYSCVCVFSSHLFWTSNSLEVPAGVTRNFSSTFLLRCMPLFFSREGFSRSFPSSTVKSS